jgi:hypothetical protein
MSAANQVSLQWRERPKGDSEAKEAPLESRNMRRFMWVKRILVAELFGAKWEPCIPFRLGKF